MFQVTISQRAQENLIDILSYLEQNWFPKIKNRFLNRFKKLVHLKAQNPYLFMVSEIEVGVRQCVITKHNMMYYRIRNNEIEIITIHDVRQNPKNFENLQNND